MSALEWGLCRRNSCTFGVKLGKIEISLIKVVLGALLDIKVSTTGLCIVIVVVAVKPRLILLESEPMFSVDPNMAYELRFGKSVVH